MAREAGRILRLDGNAGELFDRGQAGGDLRQAVVPEGSHALADRRPLDVLAARLRDREALELLAHGQELVNADPPLVAGLVASRATLLAVEDHPVAGRGDLGGDARLQQLVDGWGVHLAAVCAELSGQS